MSARLPLVVRLDAWRDLCKQAGLSPNDQLPDTKSRMVRRVFQELVEYDRHVCFYGDFAWLPKANRNSDLAAGYGRTNADNVRSCPPGETEDPRADGHGHHPIGVSSVSAGVRHRQTPKKKPAKRKMQPQGKRPSGTPVERACQGEGKAALLT